MAEIDAHHICVVRQAVATGKRTGLMREVVSHLTASQYYALTTYDGGLSNEHLAYLLGLINDDMDLGQICELMMRPHREGRYAVFVFDGDPIPLETDVRTRLPEAERWRMICIYAVSGYEELADTHNRIGRPRRCLITESADEVSRAYLNDPLVV